MKTSPKGMVEIVSHEGICLEPYLDSVGVWTIGAGQTKSDWFDPRTAVLLSIDSAFALFKKKIIPYEDAVNAVGMNFSQTQFDALVSFCYNLGPGNLRKLCRNRSIDEIGTAIMLYRFPPEIIERRKKEQRLYRTGEYSCKDGKILVFPVGSNNKPIYSKGYKIDARPYFEASQAPPPIQAGKPAEQQPKPSKWAAFFNAIFKRG